MQSTPRTATDLLSDYAAHHRDERNIMSHFVGVPLIVLALGLLLARPAFMLGGLALSPAWLLFVPIAIWYLTRGNLVLGLAVSLAIGGVLLLAHGLGTDSTLARLGWGLMFFAAGWAIQLAGHWYEGRKPAFVGDASSLLVGPLFITAEAMFMMGWNRPLQAEIARRAGPVMLRDMARIA